MKGFPQPGEAGRPAPKESPPSSSDLETLRELLFAQEKKQLNGLRERFENPSLHARDVSQVLPQAVLLASAKDGQLAAALTPAVETALQASVKRDPSILVNAIFPVFGPAIRKSISETFSKLVQTLNQVLEHSLSLQGWKWRLEAARTGRSFAEVVLAHTLLYRVEQVFLIHKQSGLLLLHLCAPHARAQDADMVSGMLTAIQDFAHDSFRAPAGEALQTLEIGELNLLVETGPAATLAAVIRGHAPREFRVVLQCALENIHGAQGPALESFDGDATPFELARAEMESCLQAQFANPGPKRSSTKLWVLSGLVLLLLAVWLGFWAAERTRWKNCLERLKAEPGIVVTESGKRSGNYFVSGLRDPLAVEPAKLLADFKIDPLKVAWHWEPYQSLTPELMLTRATTLLQPPATVALQVRDGVLIAAGHAQASWLERLRTQALLLPGIRALDESGLRDEQPASLASFVKDLQERKLSFNEGLQLTPGQEAAMEAIAAQLQDVRNVAVRTRQAATVLVVGHTDKSGTEEYNLRLSRQRAEHVVSLLIARGVPAALLKPIGVGDHEPSRPNLPQQDEPQDRRVTFRLALEDATNLPLP